MKAVKFSSVAEQNCFAGLFYFPFFRNFKVALTCETCFLLADWSNYYAWRLPQQEGKASLDHLYIW